MGMKGNQQTMLYMDYAATSPLYDEVIETIAEVMKSHYGNPSSIHRLGVEAEKLLQSAKGVIASAYQCISRAKSFVHLAVPKVIT